MLFLAFFSPLVEEIASRGFGFRQLLTAAPSGRFGSRSGRQRPCSDMATSSKARTSREMLGLFFLTGSPAVIFAWLVYRWQNLWVAVMLHIFVNLWWELFPVAKSAIGGWLPFVVQTATMLFAFLLTWYWTRPRPAAAGCQ